MNDYRIVYRLDDCEHVIEVRAETARAAELQLPADAEVVRVQFLRASGFSCHIRGSAPRR